MRVRPGDGIRGLNPMGGARDGLPLNKIGRNDICPCGSGDKFKKCHDPKFRVVIPLSTSTSLQPKLLLLLASSIDALNAEIESIPIDVSDKERFFAACCIGYHAAVTYSTASAMKDLLMTGHTREAFALRRKLLDATTGLHYYDRNSRDAALFVASEQAKRMNVLKPACDNASLSILQEQVQQAQELFPELQDRVGGRRWTEPDVGRMRAALLSIDKLPTVLKLGMSTLADQELHVTPFAIRNTIHVSRNGITVDRSYKRANFMIREMTGTVLSAVDILLNRTRSAGFRDYSTLRSSLLLFTQIRPEDLD